MVTNKTVGLKYFILFLCPLLSSKLLYFTPHLSFTGIQTSRLHWRRGRRKERGLLHRGQCVWQQQGWQVWVGGVSCWLCSGTWEPLSLQLVYRNSQSWKVQSPEVKIPQYWSHWSEGLTWRCKLSYSEFLPPGKRQRLINIQNLKKWTWKTVKI